MRTTAFVEDPVLENVNNPKTHMSASRLSLVHPGGHVALGEPSNKIINLLVAGRGKKPSRGFVLTHTEE